MPEDQRAAVRTDRDHAATPALRPAARYCDEHADQVQALFFVDCDLVLEAAVAAAVSVG